MKYFKIRRELIGRNISVQSRAHPSTIFSKLYRYHSQHRPAQKATSDDYAAASTLGTEPLSKYFNRQKIQIPNIHSKVFFCINSQHCHSSVLLAHFLYSCIFKMRRYVKTSYRDEVSQRQLSSFQHDHLTRALLFITVS